MGSHRMVDSVFHLAVRFEPGGRTAVEVCDLFTGCRSYQSTSQDVSEQAMVPIPLPAVVERLEEQTFALPAADHVEAVADPGHRISQVGSKSMKNRGAQKKRLNV